MNKTSEEVDAITHIWYQNYLKTTAERIEELLREQGTMPLAADADDLTAIAATIVGPTWMDVKCTVNCLIAGGGGERRKISTKN